MDHQRRAGVSMKKFFSYRELSVLLPPTRASERVMVDTHEQHYRGAKNTLWRSRSSAWIVGGTAIAKKISNNF